MALMLAIFVLYGFIWFIPLSVNIVRRRAGKKPYWLIFLLALVLEIASLWVFLGLSTLLGFEFVGIYLSPILSAVLASYFYWSVAERKDADAVDNRMESEA